LSSRPWPKFGHVVPDRNSFEFGRVDPSQNLAELDQVELDKSSVGLDQFGWPRPKVSRVHPMLKFGLDKKSVKFYGVGHMDTSFRKFNLNLFYEKWILDFELDPNIWIWI